MLYANQEIATVNLVAAESYSLSPFAFVGSLFSTVFHSLIFKIILVIVLLLVIAYVILVIRYNRIRKNAACVWLRVQVQQKSTAPPQRRVFQMVGMP